MLENVSVIQTSKLHEDRTLSFVARRSHPAIKNLVHEKIRFGRAEKTQYARVTNFISEIQDASRDVYFISPHTLAIPLSRRPATRLDLFLLFLSRAAPRALLAFFILIFDILWCARRENMASRSPRFGSGRKTQRGALINPPLSRSMICMPAEITEYQNGEDGSGGGELGKK